ncbi:MAG TPA: type VI secretion system lipoprotein TssJ [Gammaproteobacteria bacterium]
MTKKPLALCCSVLLVVAMTALAPPAEARETQLKGQVLAAEKINPNRRGTAQPVKLHIFYLAEDDAFLQANFGDLINPESPVLGKELIRRSEKLVGPGEMLELSESLDEAAAYIGIVAAFTDIGNASWRTVQALPVRKWTEVVRFAKGNKLEIRIDGTNVTSAIIKE